MRIFGCYPKYYQVMLPTGEIIALGYIELCLAGEQSAVTAVTDLNYK